MGKEMDEGVGELEDDFQFWQVDTCKGIALTVQAENQERTTDISGDPVVTSQELEACWGEERVLTRTHAPPQRVTPPPTHTPDLRSPQRAGKNLMSCLIWKI